MDAQNWPNVPVNPDELRKWPLIHGSLALSSAIESIRHTGLVAPGKARKGINSSSEDAELGRTNYVFLAPVSFRRNYGLGTFMLVDPRVLQKRGIRFTRFDIVKAIEYIHLSVYGMIPSPWKVEKPDALTEVINSELPSCPETEDETTWIIRSKKFKDYYQNFYFHTEDEFFGQIATEAESLGYKMSDYFNRTISWAFDEEIMVPDCVGPEYLLGYWNRREWVDWTPSGEAETRLRVALFIDAFHQKWFESPAR
jgi:hypothetical protein